MSAQLRVEGSHDEIMETLRKMHREKSPVLIWQNLNANNERITFHSYIKNIDKRKKTIDLVALDENTIIEIDENTTIYIKGEERSILFKQTQVKLTKGHLSLLIPNEVRVYERRTTARIEMGPNEYFLIELKNLVNPSGKNNSTGYKLVDISPSGIGFIAPAHHAKFLYEGDKIEITKIHEYNLPFAKKGKIVYTAKSDIVENGKKTKIVRVGVKFFHEYHEDDFQSIKMQLHRL